jgi:amidase
MQYITFSAKDLSALIADGKVKAVSVAQELINLINSINPTINAIVTIDRETVIENARIADNAVNDRDSISPLYGIPITVKDNFNVFHMRTTASHFPLKDNIAQEDAILISRLKKAGTIILGKTNMPELAMDSQTDSPLFGRTNNPWDISCTPGGSCGGGAAAVASGMSFADIGNDLLGSVRIPANFCGLFGFVPSDSVVPIKGFIPERPYIGTLSRFLRPGFLTRSIDDLELILKTTAGPVPGYPEAAIPVLLQKKDFCRRLRIAWMTAGMGIPVSNECSQIIENFINQLKELGHEIQMLNKPPFDLNKAWDVFLGMFFPAISTSMSFIERNAARIFSRNKNFNLNLKRYLDMENQRFQLVNEFDHFFMKYDIFICPVTSTPAFKHMKPDKYLGPSPIYKHGIEVNGETVNYAAANTGFTVPFTITGNPVTVIPVGYTLKGMPVGVQVVGRRYDDMNLLNMCKTISSANSNIHYPF